MRPAAAASGTSSKPVTDTSGPGMGGPCGQRVEHAEREDVGAGQYGGRAVAPVEREQPAAAAAAAARVLPAR